MEKFYIYVGIAEQGLCYIGKGQGSRYTHLASGRSSCIPANQHVLLGGEVQVHKVIENLQESVALELEAYLINYYKPEWNVVEPEVGALRLSPEFIESIINTIDSLGEVGSDIIFDTPVVTLSELVEVCVYDTYDKQESAHVRHETICFEYMEYVGVSAFQKWYSLSKLVQRRCILITTLDQIKDTTELSSRSMLSKWLTSMQEVGMLFVSYPEGVKSQRRIIYFNPWMVWKGSYRVRNRYRYLWNKAKGIE